MILEDWRNIFITICIFIILGASMPIIAAIFPLQEERFFALAVLSEEGMAEHYFPDNEPNIHEGETVNWKIFLHNNMDESQYVAVRVKLLNSTNLAPNTTSCRPSTAPVIYEFRRIVMDNETCLLPFSWSILSIENISDFLEVRSFSINSNIIETHVVSMHEYNFRIVLELWIYNEDYSDFKFGWGNEELQCAWNQVWFNVTAPS